ncbi:TolC family protein [soil metagenome]
MKKLTIILILLGCGYWSSGQILEDYLIEAAENNPELKASFHNYLAAMEKVPQVSSLPDPQLTFGYFIRPMELLMGNQRGELSLMQMFPWFGMIRNQRDEAAQMARSRYEVFREAKNQLYFQVKENWIQLHRVEEEIKITEENLELLRSLERLAIVRFQSAGSGSGEIENRGRNNMPSGQGTSPARGGGNMEMGGQTPSARNSTGSMSMASGMSTSGSGMADVLRIQIEIKEMENELHLLEDFRINIRSRFNKLLNRNLSERVALTDTLLPGSLPANYTALLEKTHQNSPMLKMLEAEQEAYVFQGEMARLEGRPMVGLGVNYMIFSPRTETNAHTGNETRMGGGNMFMPMISLSLPIYRKKYQAMAKEAELKQEEIIYQKENVTNELELQLQESLRDLAHIEREMKLYEEQTQLARQALDLMVTSYAANGTTFEEILRVQQQLLSYRIKLINAVASQNTLVATIEMISAFNLE